MYFDNRNDYGLGDQPNGRKNIVFNGLLDVEIYMDQPEEFIQCEREHLVYKFKKVLYKLKQPPKEWYHYIDSFFINDGFIGAKRIICCMSNKRVSICW